jgi:hypothetical protein
MEKRLKTRAQYWVGNWPGATVQGVAACHARPANQPTRPRPGGPVQSRRRPVTREQGTRRTYSRHGHRAVATCAAVGRHGWFTRSGGQGVPKKEV